MFIIIIIIIIGLVDREVCHARYNKACPSSDLRAQKQFSHWKAIAATVGFQIFMFVFAA